MARFVIVTKPEQAEELRRNRFYGHAVHVAQTFPEAQALALLHEADMIVWDSTHCSFPDANTLCTTTGDILNARRTGEVPMIRLDHATSRDGLRLIQICCH